MCRLWYCTNHSISKSGYQLPWEGKGGTVGAQPLHSAGQVCQADSTRLLGKHSTVLSLKAGIVTFCFFTVLCC